MLDKLISWIYTRKLFGPRCPDTVEGCATCDAWLKHDDICVLIMGAK